MLDANKRQELASKLSNTFKKASSNVSTEVKAGKGDYKVVMSTNSIDHFYKEAKVNTIKIADLSSEEIDTIQTDPQMAVTTALNTFMAEFDANYFEKKAANEAVDSKMTEVITQKQLSENQTKLHPRTNEFANNVTQKQLPENGQRPGTYNQTTEAQFREERTTFYGADRTSGDWKNEDRNIVTERQLDEQDYNEVGNAPRNETGAKFDGDLDAQHSMIGEKQLMTLLKDHTWKEPFTTTEGKDQLGKQDGELSRVTAEIAKNIIKEAEIALGKTALSLGATPEQLSNVIKQLTSHESKYAPLSQVLKAYAKKDIQAIENKIAKAKTFGKTANTSVDYSDFMTADVIIRQLSKINQHPQHIVAGLAALASHKDLEQKIASAIDNVMSEKNTNAPKSSMNIFAEILNGNDKPKLAGNANDGLYAYEGDLSEVNADVKDRTTFAQAATEYAKKQILANVENSQNLKLEPKVADIDEDKGIFQVQFADANAVSETLENRAAKRRSFLNKEAQVGGPAGGMPPAAGGGPEMGNPNMPMGGGDMGAPGGEALSQEPPVTDDMGMGEETSGEAKPPGTFCAACGSQDTDVENSEFRCNNCGGTGDILVQLNMKKWPGSIKDTEEKGKEGFDLGEGELGLKDDAISEPGGEAPSGTTLPSSPVASPVAASVRIHARMLEKLSSQNITLGKVCPSCGSQNTDISKSASTKGDDGLCWDCLQEFNVQIKAHKTKKNNVFAQYVWKPKLAEQDCVGCNRLRDQFVTSLNDYGMSWKEFDSMPSLKKAELVLKLSNDGWLNTSTAMTKEELPVTKIAASSRWNGYSKFDKFPMTSCIERLARKFGENATSMSGPCQGKNLAQCVCSQLNTLGIYTDGLSAKVASLQANPDPYINSPVDSCVKSLMTQNNYKLADACTVCDTLKVAYASSEEMLIEAIAQLAPSQMMTPKQLPSAMPPKPMPAAKPLAGPMPPAQAPASPHLAPDPMMQSPAPAPAPAMGPTPTPAPSGMAPGGPVSNVVKPMESPFDNQVSEGTEGPGDSSFGLDIGHMAPDADLGFGDDMVTIKLPHDAMHALQTLMQALQGQIDPSMIDDTGDLFGGDDNEGIPGDEVGNNDILDIGDSEEIVDSDDNDNDDDNTPPSGGSDDDSTEENGDSGIPGLSDDSDDELIKNSLPESDDSDNSEKSDNSDEKKDESWDDKEDSDSDIFAQKETEMNKEAQTKFDSFLSSMKRGSVRTQAGALDNIFEGILRQAKITKAAEEIKKVKSTDSKSSKIKVSPAQDSSSIGKVQDNGTLGHEEPFSKGISKKPDVPRGDALIGDESKDLKISETEDLPSVPHGSGNMEGEKHYKPEQGNVVDGNQGNKHASKKCNCKKENCKECKKACMASGVTFTVKPGQQYYSSLQKKAQSGENNIQLTDGNFYNMSIDKNNNIILAQVKVERMEDGLADDPDLNPKSGPGAGKTHDDSTHSLAVDEKKPSEGMNKPDVPQAPNGGQLSREHSSEVPKDGPEIPTGKGMDPEKDKNKELEPEKTNRTLGNDTYVGASNDEAMKIAGQMLKANLISIDDLPNKVQELSKSTPEIRADYKKLIAQAYDTKGMKKEASINTSEIVFNNPTNDTNDSKSKNTIGDLFTLSKRNNDYANLQSIKDRI